MDARVNSAGPSDLSYRRHSVLIIDAEADVRQYLHKGLEKRFGLVEVAANSTAAESLLERCNFDLVIADIRVCGSSAVDWVNTLRREAGTTAVIFISADADLDLAIEALRAGASDFVTKPFHLEQMLAAIEQVMQTQQVLRENIVLRRQLDSVQDHGIVGQCETIRSVCDLIKRVGPMPTTVLIDGETGTGKELAARAIHAWSGRDGNFVAINCGAMTAELLESELFGHIKGAFTGAHQAREGLFTYADGGTLFLDEIGEMPLSLQVHLLRVLEEQAIRPVGSNRVLPVDVRIIAASNRDLHAEVDSGRFREDLFYRLNVVNIRIPPLRERLEDIPALVEHFMHTLATEMGIDPRPMGAEELAQLRSYAWPGNIRELKNVIERCLLLRQSPGQCLVGMPGQRGESAEPSADNLSLAAVEKRHILKVLDLEGGNKSAAARVLGVSRKTLERKLSAWREA